MLRSRTPWAKGAVLTLVFTVLFTTICPASMPKVVSVAQAEEPITSPLTDITFTPTLGLQEGNVNVAPESEVGSLTATGGVATPVTYSLVSGDGSNDADNAKFKISDAKVLVASEIPLSAGDYSFLVQATDSSGSILTKAFSITVAPVVSTVARLEVSASPAAGSASSTITATAYDAADSFIEGTTVSFATTLGTLTSDSAITASSGTASVTLNTTTSGTAIVTATCDAVSAQVEVELITDADAIAADAALITTAAILGDNISADEVTTNLSLPTSGPNGSILTWLSSNPSLIATDGSVTRPTYIEGDVQVTLTASIAKGVGNAVDKTFDVTIVASIQTDADAVAADEAWLTEAELLNGNEAMWSLTRDIDLPTSGPNGSTISWVSSDETLLTVTGDLGVVTRPEYLASVDEDGLEYPYVGLEATITKGTVTPATKQFHARIKPQEPTAAEEALVQDYEGLNEHEMKNWLIGDVAFDLNLPTLGDKGSIISWESSDTSIIAIDGTFTAPTFTQGDTQVILTATLSNGEASLKKVFDFTATALEATDEEAVIHDANWLTEERVLDANSSLNNIRYHLNLPTSGHYETRSSISWIASDETVVATDGTVTRPTEAEGPQSVTLTATIVRGEATQTKTFDLIVTVAENYPVALMFDDFAQPEEMLEFNGIAGVIPVEDPYYYDTVKALRFDTYDTATGGSVFTKNKVHLNDDLSFSAYLAFRTKPFSSHPLGDGGFSFTLQPVANNLCGDSQNSLATDGISPSVSVAFETHYYKSQGSGQGTSYGSSIRTAAFVNGNYAQPLDSDRYSIPRPLYGMNRGGTNHAWVEYDGAAQTLAVRVSTEERRPQYPTFVLESVDLASLLLTGSDLTISDIQDVYVGFTGATGELQEVSDILKLYFKNNATPIDFNLYDFTDASRISLVADPAAGQSTSTLTATLSGGRGSTAGVPVEFFTTFGSLNTPRTTTNSTGQAAVVLSTEETGPAMVTAIAEGGAYTTTLVELALTDADRVASDETWLTTELILGANTTTNDITQNLYLPTVGHSGSNIEWASSNPGVIAPSGEITFPLPAAGDQVVELTATISLGTDPDKVSVDKVFTVSVKVPAADVVAADNAWLTDELVLNGNSALDNVVANLNLPQSGGYGSSISWASTDEALVALGGTATRPAFVDGNATATLTATITKGDQSLTKTFEVTVKCIEPTDAEAVAAAANELTEKSVWGENDNSHEVILDLNLATAGGYGTSISWTSSNEPVVAVNGSVTRPTFSQGDQEIVLIATIARGEETAQKSFLVTVRSLPPTDAEAVAVDAAWLEASQTLGQNTSQYGVTMNLQLPLVGPHGSAITWFSNNSAVLSETGTVTRPAPEASYAYATLTAVLVRGDVEQSKPLEYIILPLPDVEPPFVVSTTPEDNSTGVLYDSGEVVVTFNEEVKQGPSWAQISFGSVGFTPRIENDKLIVDIEDMEFSRNYLLDIPADAIVDKSNNPLAAAIELSFTTEKRVVNKIQVVSTTPSDKDKSVPLDTAISFRYNHTNIIEGPTFRHIGLNARGRSKLPATLSLSGDTVSLMLEPGTQLEPGEVYELKIPSGAVADRYRNYSLPKTVLFRIETDHAAPEIVSSYPVDGQEGVDLRQVVEITASESVAWNPSRYSYLNRNVHLLDAAGDRVLATLSWGKSTGDSRKLIIKPQQPLRPQTRYTVVVPYRAVKSRSSGNLMFEDHTISFTTGAGTLNVVGATPNDATNYYYGAKAPIDTGVEIKFSAPITRVEGAGDIQLLDATGTQVSCILEESDATVLLTPLRSLSPSASYTVRLPAGAYQNSSGQLNDTYQFSFAVADKVNTYNWKFAVNPGIRFLTDRPMTFDATNISNNFGWRDRDIASYEWNFGDGQTASGEVVEKTYTASGNYTVVLTLTDDKGLSYSFEETVKIGDVSTEGVNMYITPGSHTRLIRLSEDLPWWEKGLQIFEIYLSYHGAKLPNESVTAFLYKEGELVSDALYISDTDNNGKTRLNFSYGAAEWIGRHELVFVHGDIDTGTVKRVPITFEDYSDFQHFRIELYDPEKGRKVDFYTHGLYFEVNGEKVYAKRRWFGESEGYSFVVENLPVDTIHSVALVDDNIVNDSDIEIFYHTGAAYVNRLPVRWKQPGINYIKSEYSDTRGFSDRATFMQYTADPIEFELHGDDNGAGFGYYELKASGLPDSINHFHRTTKYNSIVLYPGLILRPGERLLVRMVSKYGIASPWVDANIKVVPRPYYGYGMTVNLVDGEYRVDTDISTTGLIGSRISILDEFPFLNRSSSFGLDSSSNRLKGVLDRDSIYLYAGGGYTHGKEKKIGARSAGYEVGGEMKGTFLLRHNHSEGEWYLARGYLWFTGDGNYYWKRDYTVPVIDVGISSTLKMGSGFGGTLEFERDGTAYDYEGIIYFAPYVSASIEAGFDWVSVEGYLAGSIPGEVHIPTGYIEIEPTISTGIVGHFLLWSKTLYEKVLVKYHWDNGGTKVALAMADSLSQSLNNFNEEVTELAPTPRAYLNRDSIWLVGQKGQSSQMGALNAPLAKAANPAVDVLKSNIYPQADVKLARSGDELWLVWSEDNPERSNMNRTQLMYSVYKNGAWAEPEWLGDDGSADFTPVVTATPNGALMAWQNISQAMPDDVKEGDLIANAEISVTLDPVTSGGADAQVATLTNDDKFDHSPKLASYGDNALLVWTKSEGVGFALSTEMEKHLSTPNSDKLVYAVWEGNDWSEPAEIDSELPTVVQSDLTMHGDQALLIYTLDMDNDITTSGDREVFARIYNGNTWGEAMCLTDNTVAEINPQAVYSNNQWFITWYQDGSIYYQEGLNGPAKTEEFLTKVQPVYDIAIKDGQSSQITLTYRVMGEDTARGLSTSFYDIENGVWSDEITLTDAEGSIISFDSVFTNDGKLNVAYTQAEIMTEVIDGTEYLKPSDKVDLRLLSYTPQHDIAFSSEGGLLLTPEIPLPSTIAWATAVISNEGDYASNATLKLYVGDPEEDGVLVGEMSTTDPIAARSSALVEMEWLVPAGERDKYDMYAVVESDSALVDVDTSNNTLHQEVHTADIAITDLECVNIAGDDYLVEATVSNSGSRTLSNVQVELADALSAQVVKSTQFEELRPGQVAGVRYIISADGRAADENGDINMTLKSSSPGVTEFDSNNNSQTFTLVPAEIAVVRMSPAPGETLVGIQQPITLGFNMKVEAGAGFEDITLLDDYLNQVAITKVLDGKALTITPQDSLQHNTRYTLSIPANALGDSYGHSLREDYSLSFKTTLSTPEIVFTYPAMALTDAARDSNLRLQFNQSIRRGSDFGDIVLYGPGSQAVPISVYVNDDWLEVKPSVNLAADTTFTLVVPAAAVTNDAGEVLPYEYILGFETGQATGQKDENNDSRDDDDDSPSPAYNVNRQTAEDGTVTLAFNLHSWSIARLTDTNEDTVTLDVSTMEQGDEAVAVELAAGAVTKLVEGQRDLQLKTSRGQIVLPFTLLETLADSIQAISINIASTGEVEDLVADLAAEDEVLDAVDIEANYTGTTVLRLPMPEGVSDDDLASVMLLVKHSDGSTEWIKPVLVTDEAGEKNLEFTVDHFSTFITYKTANPITLSSILVIGDTAIDIDCLFNAEERHAVELMVNQLIAKQELSLDDLWYRVDGGNFINLADESQLAEEEILRAVTSYINPLLNNIRIYQGG